MSVVIKKIRNRRYAYVAYRVGKKVVQKYMGPLSDPAVAAKVKKLERQTKIPNKYRNLFWDATLDQIDLKTNARYIIERVLESGDLNAFYWIQNTYPTRQIAETCQVSRKISPKAKNFWSIWLGISGEDNIGAS